MKVTEYKSGGRAAQVLAGMATDRAVCGAVAARWDGRMFGSRWENLVAGWCVAHYEKYRKAPGRAVESYFDAWAAKKSRDKDAVDLVEAFLQSLSDRFAGAKQAPASEYLLDLAARHFDEVRVRNLREELEGDLGDGDLEAAKDRIRKFSGVGVGQKAGMDLYQDEEPILAAFEDDGDNVFKWGQPALDNFFAGALEREAFIAFQAVEKRGKSFWLQEVAWAASQGGADVAFFETGDQSQRQILRRIAARAAGRPFRPDKRVQVPVSMQPGEPPRVEYETRSFPDKMTGDEARRAVRRAGKRSGVGRLKLSVHPNTSISVEGISGVLSDWERTEAFVPSVVVVDYADVMAPMSKKDDDRAEINDTWKALRRLSQEAHCLLVVATQAKAEAAEAITLTRKHFANDKRKYGHVTGMVGINQTEGEKAAGVFRLNWILGRDLDFPESTCVYTAGCLPLANPCILSTF